MSTAEHKYTWSLLPAAIMTFGPVVYMTADRPILGLAWAVFAIATMRKTGA